jgi:hypothetical protein
MSFSTTRIRDLFFGSQSLPKDENHLAEHTVQEERVKYLNPTNAGL